MKFKNFSTNSFKLKQLLIYLAFSITMLAISSNVLARGGHGNHSGSVSSMGSISHGGGFSGHRGNHGSHIGGQRHFGGGSHFGGSRRYSNSHNNHSHSNRYNYYPYGSSYRAYTPRYYSTPSRNYISNSTRYAPTTTYISRDDVVPVYSNNTNVQYIEKSGANSFTNNSSGWNLLAQNNAREALGVFAIQASQHQSDSIPKVGYALSEAMQGDLAGATWAMRRAFRIDPNSLHYIKIEQPLRAHLDHLLKEYNNYLNQPDNGKYSDAIFMIAALNY